MRDQDNQSDVFRLNKFLQSNDADYKPVISNLIGIDGSKIKLKYDIESEIKQINQYLLILEKDLGSYRAKESIEEEISVYTRKIEEKEQRYKDFNFYLEENNISKELIDKNEKQISELNQERNSINREIDYINHSMQEEIVISIDDIQGLFNEMKILFPDDLKTNYENVVKFNKQIAKERKQIFEDNKKLYTSRIKSIEEQLNILNQKRMDMLSILENSDTMDKFKKLENELVIMKSKTEILKDELNIFEDINNKKLELEKKEEELKKVILENKTLINNGFIDKIKINLSKYGKLVFNRDIAFSVGFNAQDNIDFYIKLSDRISFDNDLEDGKTNKKLLCFIFSAAIAEAYKDKNFINFVAFDSPFDGDKNTYQDGTFNAIKELSNNGVQVIITSITDTINNDENLKEIKEKYTIRYLSENDKLLGDF